MNEFTPNDVKDTQKEGTKKNYLGEYIPENFWNDYGKYYLYTFSIKDKEKGKSELKLNIQPLLARLHSMQSRSILEVGCGFGRCLPFILQNVKSAERVVGVDFSSTQVEKSKEYLAMFEGGSKIKVSQSDAKSLPFEDNEFDSVFTHVCLTHIPPENIPKITREISRVAKNWIIHIERFHFPYERPNPHRWSHLLAPYYTELGWTIWENDVINEEHYTNVLVLKAQGE